MPVAAAARTRPRIASRRTKHISTQLHPPYGCSSMNMPSHEPHNAEDINCVALPTRSARSAGFVLGGRS
eukprot:364326-Chlamydomonas_euryale.AAC.10